MKSQSNTEPLITSFFDLQYSNVPSQTELMAYSEFENSQSRSTSIYTTDKAIFNKLLIILEIRHGHVESKTSSRTALGGETNLNKMMMY